MVCVCVCKVFNYNLIKSHNYTITPNFLGKFIFEQHYFR